MKYILKLKGMDVYMSFSEEEYNKFVNKMKMTRKKLTGWELIKEE